MSTTLLIGRWPAAIRRAFSHSGDGPDLHVGEHAHAEPRAELEVVDRRPDQVGGCAASRRFGLHVLVSGIGRQRRAGDRVHLARDAVHRQAVGAVRA